MTDKEKKGSKVRQDLRDDVKVITDFVPRIVEFIKKHKKTLIIAGAVLAVFGAIATYQLMHWSSTPDFCNLFCHEMTPEVETWRASQHAKRGFECVECHYAPGIMGVLRAKFNAQWQLLHHITGSYADNALEKAKEHDPIDFEITEQHIHQKGNKVYYIKAHGYALEVINDNCVRCHPDFATMVRSSGRSVRMAHEKHINSGYKCTHCHVNIVHGSDPKGFNFPTMQTCFKCHDDEKAPRTDCTLCHVGQDEMWKGIGAKAVDDEPAMMLGETDCVDCHDEDERYAAPKDGEVCVDCHDDEEYADYLKEWQVEVRKKTTTLNNILDELYERMKKIKATGKAVASFDKANELYENAKFNAAMVEHDGSKGAHNYDYAVSMLDASLKMAREARGILTAEK